MYKVASMVATDYEYAAANKYVYFHTKTSFMMMGQI